MECAGGLAFRFCALRPLLSTPMHVAGLRRDDLAVGEGARRRIGEVLHPVDAARARADVGRCRSNVDSLAKRVSPPGTSDCSGSQYLALPLKATVLIAGEALGAAHGVDRPVDQALLAGRGGAGNDEDRAEQRDEGHASWGSSQDGWTSLGEQEPAYNYSGFFGGVGAAGGGAGLRCCGAGCASDGVELAAADAAVAVAVDGDPVAVLRRRGGQLCLAQVAVLVAIEALEQRALRARRSRSRRGRGAALRRGPATRSGTRRTSGHNSRRIRSSMCAAA